MMRKPAQSLALSTISPDKSDGRQFRPSMLRSRSWINNRLGLCYQAQLVPIFIGFLLAMALKWR
jgi:hypothetical protein